MIVRCGMNAPMISAYTGRRAEQVMRGAIMMVASRSRGFWMVRVAMIPGMAQAKLDSKGMNARPESPTLPITRSSKKAARGRYPVSSRIRMKKNRMMICGRNTRTLPTPARTPFTSRSLSRLAGNPAPSQSPNAATPNLIAFIGHCAQANTARTTRTRLTARITGPNRGCSTTASTRSLKVTPWRRSPPTNPRIRRTSVWSCSRSNELQA